MSLDKPSILNGSQTQGEIAEFLDSLDTDVTRKPAHVKFELIVTSNEDLIAEISISRNFQNDVKEISIVGRRGLLKDLEASLQKARGTAAKLQSSETELSEDFIRTERLLQIITVLIPEELQIKSDPSKTYAYSKKSKCLKEFQSIHAASQDKTHPQHKENRDLYQFYLDIANDALDLYDHWKSHQGFAGTGIRAIKRSKSGEILEVPDGIVFPILAALSAFGNNDGERWRIEPPASFNEDEMIQSAKSVYIEIADHNPSTMGKTRACYSALFQITSIYKRLSS